MGAEKLHIEEEAKPKEINMTRLQEKAQARIKQVVGQMIGDDKLVVEGKEEERRAEEKKTPGDRDDQSQAK